MRIDRERGCYKVSFESDLELATLQKKISDCAEQVDGLMSAGELLREGEGYVFCIRHRDSLKAYLEHAVFELEQFLSLLRNFQTLIERLRNKQFPIYDCVWDIDCIFVGGGMEDLEFVYLPGISSNTGSCYPKAPFRFSDLLAVVSLRVYETQVPALQALSEVIGMFSQWEDEILLTGKYNTVPFDTAKRLLAPHCREQNPFVRSVRKALDSMRIAKDAEPEPQTGSKLLGICWERRARLCLEGIGLLKGRKIVLQGNFDIREGESVRIGRHTEQFSFKLPYPVVSRNQAAISYQGGEWFLTDLDSVNGTFLDDIRINPGIGYPLLRGHSFYFAHREIGFRIKRV